MKAYKYKLKPSAKVVAIFESWLAILCELYNAALQERRDAYRINRLSINYLAQANQLPEIKAERPDLAGIHSQVIQNVLKRVEFAFDNFFRRVEEGHKVNPSYTSQDCSRCGYRNRITLATRIYRCSQCELVIHRDRNAAKRIEQKGRAVPSGSRQGVACEEPRTYRAADLESPAITR